VLLTVLAPHLEPPAVQDTYPAARIAQRDGEVDDVAVDLDGRAAALGHDILSVDEEDLLR